MSDRADAGGINSKLGLVPKWQAIANDLNPACIGWHWEIHVCKAHASGDRDWPTRRQLARAGGRGKNPMHGKHRLVARNFAEAMVAASFVRRTVKQQATCGPAWDRQQQHS